jgi:hypothetical protein
VFDRAAAHVDITTYHGLRREAERAAPGRARFDPGRERHSGKRLSPLGDVRPARRPLAVRPGPDVCGRNAAVDGTYFVLWGILGTPVRIGSSGDNASAEPVALTDGFSAAAGVAWLLAWTSSARKLPRGYRPLSQ